VIGHGALLRSASAYVPALETSSADRTLALVPLFHNTGFVDQLTQMLAVGGALDLVEEFGVSAALAALARRPATYLIAVPSIFRLLMLDPGADAAFERCRVAVYGGAPMPRAWIEELAARWPGVGLFNSYGLTEFTSVSHLLGPEHALARSDSVGRPVEGVDQRVVNERGTLEPGRVGEILLQGPMRMLGYWNDEQATRLVLDDGWLRTGDVGSVDAEGFLTLLGRSAEVINRGGEKIHAAQVEGALNELEEVADAAVVGAPHPIFHESVVACVVLRDGQELDEEAARSHLLEHVPDYAVPETFVLVDGLPRNPGGKLDRRRIRELVAGLSPAGER
jgi:acyl-CoA synthetase (AMP-forming)/AMP-acid ligase II